MTVDTPPRSRCRISSVLASGLSVRSPWRASGGTAITERARSAVVTALVFTGMLLRGLKPRHYSGRNHHLGTAVQDSDIGMHDPQVASRAIVTSTQNRCSRMRSAKPRPHFVLAPVLRAVGIVLIACATAFPFDATATSQEQTLDADAYFAAIVKVHARALPDARSAATLGSEREGTGIVIEKGGLTLTIGYLIVEADDLQL